MTQTRIAGYVVVRVLGRGSRADVYLGRAPHATDRAGVALKVYRPDADRASVEQEIDVLVRLEAPALPRLVDIVSHRDGRTCAILERLPGPTLADWQDRRGRPHPGELVTAYAPLVATLDGLHRAGWCLPGLAPGGARLSSDGRPVLTSLRGLRRSEDPRDPAPEHADVRRLAEAVANAIVAAGWEPPAAIARMADGGVPSVSTTRLEEALFDWAEPCALEPVTAAGLDAAQSVLVPVVPPARGRTEGPASDAAPPPVADARRWWDRIARTLDRSPSAEALAFLRGRFARSRGVRVVGVAAAIAVLVSVVVLSVLPAHQKAGGPVVTTEPSADGTTHPSPSAGATITESTPAIRGDDPVAAVAPLLERRAACLASTDGDCLADVDQPGSPLAEADEHARAGGLEGLVIALEAPAVLLDRSGDAAVVGLGETSPASLLLVRGEAGWRLRDVFD